MGVIQEVSDLIWKDPSGIFTAQSYWFKAAVVANKLWYFNKFDSSLIVFMCTQSSSIFKCNVLHVGIWSLSVYYLYMVLHIIWITPHDQSIVHTQSVRHQAMYYCSVSLCPLRIVEENMHNPNQASQHVKPHNAWHVCARLCGAMQTHTSPYVAMRA